MPPAVPPPRAAARFARAAWALLLYTVAVVLWGAFVRASFSGAGCGDHWPLCNGEIVPPSPSVETLIELTHRVTSGLALIGTVALFVLARRVHPARSPVRRAAAWSLFFMVTEALVGAGLVLFQMVAENTSTARGAWMSAHLVNTFLLLAALALTAYFASGGAPPRRARGATTAFSAALLLGLLLVGTSGAIAALGDTLFPVASFREGLAQELSPTAHLFVRLRIWHPVLAVLVGAAAAFGAAGLARRAGDRALARHAALVVGLVATELLLGLWNVWLLAPVWLQLVHLAVADALWVAVVLFVVRVHARDVSPAPARDALAAPAR